MEIINNVSKTAFLTCLARSKDNDDWCPILGDKFAHLFLNNPLGNQMQKEFGGEWLQNYGICARHRIIDEFIQTEAKTKKTLVINVGCGLDTRPFRIASDVDFWLEIDTKDIIAFKNSILPENYSEVKTQLKRVIIDFENEQLSDTIKNNIPSEKYEQVIFIFEGIFMYLSLEIIQKNMNEIRKIFDDFIIAFDYFSQEFHDYKGKKIENSIKKELDAQFTFLPTSLPGFLTDLKLNQISVSPITKTILKYKARFFPYQFLFYFIPNKLNDYAIVFAKNIK